MKNNKHNTTRRPHNSRNCYHDEPQLNEAFAILASIYADPNYHAEVAAAIEEAEREEALELVNEITTSPEYNESLNAAIEAAEAEEAAHRIPVNNGRALALNFTAEGLTVYHVDHRGNVDRVDLISDGDIITALNWINYQRENGNAALTF